MEQQLLNQVSYDVIQVNDKPLKRFNFVGVTGSKNPPFDAIIYGINTTPYFMAK